jgi:putative acyltransferase|uniref:lysophospholipid acyltransferase family protein n=1 Tax=Roseburia sp. TaxID=2049040 RepID=UPI003FEF9DAE
MLKFIYVILMNLFRAPYMIPKMRHEADHPEKYSMEERYALCRHAIRLMKRTGGIHTKAYGTENLPAEGGYMMYPNHQGKYDALGIMDTHDRPCSLVMDKAKSNTILVKEFVDLVQGKRLDKKNVRQALSIINEVAKEVSNGARYILFPEGGYDFNNRNNVCNFKAGSFKIALKSKAPIVPVALIDSYRVFNSFWMGPVTTQVHYLKPIYFEEYGSLRTQEIANLVRDRIQEKIDEVLS